LISWIEHLPYGSQWHITPMEVIGYKTTNSIWLIWQDPLKVVKDIFSHPILANHKTYDP
ncbi:hypothetical protein OG21DRAFT_1399185, partial [Imleria badia]